MSFATEMKDFLSAFQVTSGVVGDAKDRKLKREMLKAEMGPSLDDLGEGYDGPQALPIPTLDSDTQDDGSSDDGQNDDKGDLEIDIPPVLEKKNKVYGPGGTTAYYAEGGSVRTGTQPGRLAVDMSNMNEDLLDRWKTIQQQFGKELNVVSAYRSPKRNRKAGGAKKSQHMHGNAIDVDVSGLSRPERLELIKLASGNGITGIGVYNNSLHFDLGGRRVWGPSYKAASVPGWAKGAINEHLKGTASAAPRTAIPETPVREASERRTAAPRETFAEQGSEDATDWRDRLRARFSGGDTAPAAIPVMDGETDNSALDSFYSNNGMDISAIDVPEPAVYKAGDMTAIPQPTAYMADGGTVPWAGEQSYVRRPMGYGQGGAGGGRPRPGRMPFQRQAYVPRYTSPPSGDDDDNNGGGGGGGGGGMSWLDLQRYNRMYSGKFQNFMYANNMNPGPTADLLYLGTLGGLALAGGGAIPDGKVDFQAPDIDALDNPSTRGPLIADETGEVVTEPQTRVGVLRDREALPRIVPNSAPAPKKPVSLGQALDLGMKHLMRSLGLGRTDTAVGPDPKLQNRRKALIEGQLSEAEPPPSPEDMKQVFKTVDPSGKLNDSLRTIYAMRKGVEYYLSRGETDKASKWAAGLIQYSNLVSRQYGLEAVKAGKEGDLESMVQLAVKSYDAIPDGMNVSAKLNGGAVNVTRTDDEGNVVDTYRLTPQQVFQMATGISQGSGYFDALMDVADPRGTRKKATGIDPKARAQAILTRFKGVEKYASPEERDALQQALAAGDFTMANDIVSDAAAKAPKPEVEKPETPTQKRLREAAEASTGVYTALYPKIAKEITAEEQTAWDAAVAANSVRDLKTVFDMVSDRLSAKEKTALKVDQIAALTEMRPDYEADLTAAQKKALDVAIAQKDVERIEKVYADVDRVRRDKQSKLDEEARYQRRLEEGEARAAAKADADAVKAEKLKPIDPRNLPDIESDVDDTISSLFTSDSDVAIEDIPKTVNDNLGAGAYERIRSLAISITGYNTIPAEDTMGYITDLITSPNSTQFRTDKAGNLVVSTPSGEFRLPQSERRKVDSVMSAGGVRIDDGIFSGIGYNVEKIAPGGGAPPPESAIPAAPAPAPEVTPQSNAGKPIPPALMEKAKQEIARGRSRQGVIDKLRQNGYDTTGL